MAYSKQNTRVPRFVIAITFSGNNGTVSKAQVSASLEAILINDANSNDVIVPNWKEVLFDLIDPAISGINITAAGKTVTYQQLAALCRQAALDRANAQGIT